MRHQVGRGRKTRAGGASCAARPRLLRNPGAGPGLRRVPEVFLARVLRGELLVGEKDVGAERLDGLLELAARDVPDDLLLALDRAVGVLARGVVPDRSEERRVGKTTIATWS